MDQQAPMAGTGRAPHPGCAAERRPAASRWTPGPAVRTVRTLKGFVRDRLAGLVAARVGVRWRRGVRMPPQLARPFGTPLVVSLTSYPARYATLLPTLQSLLMQSIRPDHVELWVAERDVAALPAAVLALRDHGLAIRTCEDLRSYKKIIPALQAHPDAIIVTADDDAYYWPTWLQELVEAYDPAKREVLCHRAHRMRVRDRDGLAPYRSWIFETPDRQASSTIFPTGLGGILYRPGIFAEDVFRQDLFQTCCPTADDIWLFWMASLNGASFRKVGPVRRFVLWPGAQAVALYNHNVVGADANDVQIAAMLSRYGLPLTRTTP